MKKRLEASAETPTYATWIEFEAALNKIIAESAAIPNEIVAGARTLIEYSFGRYRVPTWVSEGYWPTIRLGWALERNPIEVEIFKNRYEVYQYFCRETKIRCVPFGRGEFPDSLKLILDDVIALPKPMDADGRDE